MTLLVGKTSHQQFVHNQNRASIKQRCWQGFSIDEIALLFTINTIVSTFGCRTKRRQQRSCCKKVVERPLVVVKLDESSHHRLVTAFSTIECYVHQSVVYLDIPMLLCLFVARRVNDRGYEGKGGRVLIQSDFWLLVPFWSSARIRRAPTEVLCK